jgi:hypothetical protein
VVLLNELKNDSEEKSLVISKYEEVDKLKSETLSKFEAKIEYLEKEQDENQVEREKRERENLIENLSESVEILKEKKNSLESENGVIFDENQSLKKKLDECILSLEEQKTLRIKYETENEDLKSKYTIVQESLNKTSRHSSQFENLYNSSKVQLNRQETELIHRYEVEKQLENHIIQIENDFQNKFTILSNQTNTITNDVIRHQNEIINRIEEDLEILEVKFETINILVSRLTDKLQKKVKTRKESSQALK